MVTASSSIIINVFNLQDSSLREYNIGTCITGTKKKESIFLGYPVVYHQICIIYLRIIIIIIKYVIQRRKQMSSELMKINVQFL